MHIAEGLYDVGLRNGDLIIITPSSWISNADLTSDTEENNYKRAQLFEGAITMYLSSYLGEIG